MIRGAKKLYTTPITVGFLRLSPRRPYTRRPGIAFTTRITCGRPRTRSPSVAYSTGTMPPSEFPASAPGPTTAVLLTDSLEKPSLDDRDYRVIRLPNELEALLVHDPETDKASAALDVNVGNFSDEDGMPGMAHAVEHVSSHFVHCAHLGTSANLSLPASIHGNQKVPGGK